MFASCWSCRRRVVVASSSLLRRYFLCIGRYTRTATQSFPSKYEKWRKSRAKRLFWRSQVTKWEVVFAFCVTGAILISVSIQMRRFFVASAALCHAAFRQVVAGAAFCVVAKVLFRQVALSGTRKRDTTSNIVAGAAFGEYLGKWRKLRKSHTCGI